MVKETAKQVFYTFTKNILTYISVLISIVEGHHIGHRLTPKNNIYTAHALADSAKTAF